MSEFNADNKESLNLNDLLSDEEIDSLSEYLSLSFEPIGNDTKVSVTTTGESPVTYSSTLTGVTITDLQFLLDFPSDPNVE